MAPAFVQDNGGSQSGGPNASLAVAYTSGVTAGNLLVAFLSWETSTSGESVADSQGNTWTKACAATNSQPHTTSLWYAVAGSSGPNTVTVTWPTGGGNWDALLIHEYSGVNTLDQTATGSGGSAAVSIGPATTLHADELLFAGWNPNGGITTQPSGWSQRLNTFGQQTVDQIVSATGSYTMSATDAGANAWSGVMATFFYQSPTDNTTKPARAGLFDPTLNSTGWF